jgi:hypothetical protein
MGMQVARDYILKSKLFLLVLLTLAVAISFFVNSVSVKATPLPVISKSGTITSSETWTAGSVYMISGSLTVSSGVTLTINPGAIVKNEYGGGIAVASGGILDAEGTSQDPVVFTSYKDDSVGGDSNGDGGSVGTIGDSGSLIVENTGGDVTISHAILRNSNYAVSANCVSVQGSTTLSDNTFNNTVHMNGCTHGSVNLVRNTFAIPNNSGWQAIEMQLSALESLVMSGSNQNTFSGDGQSKVVNVYNSIIPASQTWSVDSATGAVIQSANLEVNGTLNLGQGTLVKVSNPDDGLKINEGGTLNINGSSGAPVVITSLKDDSRGGDSNGDGNYTTASPANYNYGIFLQDGVANVSYAQIYYSGIGLYQVGDDSESQANNLVLESSNSGLSVSGGKALFNSTSVASVDNGMVVGGGVVTYRGSFDNVTGHAIESCNWGSEDVCSVDAAYTAWGSIYGPFGATANEDLTCGAVTVTPWVHNNTTYDTSPLFNVRNCDNSPTPAEELASAAAAHSQMLAAQQIDCQNGFQDACNAINSVFACLTGAIDVAASTTPFSLPGSSPTEQATTFAGGALSGASTYVNSMEVSSPTGFGLSFASGLYSAAGTIRSLASAYGSCAP